MSGPSCFLAANDVFVTGAILLNPLVGDGEGRVELIGDTCGFQVPPPLWTTSKSRWIEMIARRSGWYGWERGKMLKRFGGVCLYLCTVNSKLFPALTITSCASLCLRLYISVLFTLITASPAFRPAASAGDPVFTCDRQSFIYYLIVRIYRYFKNATSVSFVLGKKTIDVI